MRQRRSDKKLRISQFYSPYRLGGGGGGNREKKGGT